MFQKSLGTPFKVHITAHLRVLSFFFFFDGGVMSEINFTVFFPSIFM